MDLTTQKHIFGFDKGYIWLVENSLYAEEDFILRKSSARFCVKWGWYFYAEPDELPKEYQLRKLFWEEVGNEDGSLKDIVLIPENSIGEIGERIEITVKIVAATDYNTRYGRTRSHQMIDESGNYYIWTTAAKSWDVNTSHHIRGTIKEFNNNVCVLTRCMER